MLETGSAEPYRAIDQDCQDGIFRDMRPLTYDDIQQVYLLGG